jgi:alpha-D-ribose 1-methylphosphonate 5-triphosphate synthase subunit PhnG
MQEHQFKARGIGEGIREGTGPVGSRTRARTKAHEARELTRPRSPKFATAARKRGAGVLSRAEQEEIYMQEHQFKARGIGEGVPEGGRGGAGSGSAAASSGQIKSLTRPQSPKFVTASRKRAASVLSRAEQEEIYMRSHQFKPRAVGEGVPETTCTHNFKKPTSTIAKGFLLFNLSTAARRRPVSVLTREEQEVEYMRSHQFKPRVVGEGVTDQSSGSSGGARPSAQQESFKPTVPCPPKLRTSSRKRAAAVLSTAEYEEIYMQENQFKARRINE